MSVFYVMDTEIPIPKYSSLCFYDEIKEKSVSELDTSYTKSVLDWSLGEFGKIFRYMDLDFEINYDNLLISFYKSYYISDPIGFYNLQENLAAISLGSHTKGSYSNLQRCVIHELTHAITSSYSIVGVSLAEGIALYMEYLYCRANYIDDEVKKSNGYDFGVELFHYIKKYVYNDDLNSFFKALKRGNEELLINDINNFLKKVNIKFGAEEFLRFSSFIFYTRDVYASQLDENRKSKEAGLLTVDLLTMFYSKSASKFKINEYADSMKYICSLYKVLEELIGNKDVLYTTLDREFGHAMLENGGSIFLDRYRIIEIVKKTLVIMKIDEKTIDGFDSDIMVLKK